MLNYLESGQIKAQLFAGSPIKVIHIQMELDSGKLIVPLQLIEPEGLTSKKSWYLYEEIRNYCFNEANKYLVAPKPSIAKPNKNEVSDDSHKIIPAKKLKKTKPVEKNEKIAQPKKSRKK